MDRSYQQARTDLQAAIDRALAAGVAWERIIVDPTVGGLGYGLEYSYTVMERAMQAALCQQDAKLQYPLYCNLGKEVWKVKPGSFPAGPGTAPAPQNVGVRHVAVRRTAAPRPTAGPNREKTAR